MLIAVNSFARRQRRRVAMIAAILALSAAVVGAHSALGADHMGGAIGHGLVMCLAVVEVAAVAVAAAMVVLAIRGRLTWLPVALAMSSVVIAPAPPQPRARAGPALLSVFRH